MLDNANKGWFAGILDFQGHVVRRNNGHRAEGSEHISIYVDTKITPITMKMSALTGTQPSLKENGHASLKVEWLRRGCAEHCPEPHQHVASEEVNMPPTVKWSASGAAAAIVLWNLRPYMVTEHEPWDWAMGMCLASTRLSGRGAAAALTAIRRLHELGWDLPPLFRDSAPRELEAAS